MAPGVWALGARCFVWTRAPFRFWNELVAVDRLDEQRTAAPGEVKRLGEGPIVIVLSAADARIEIAANRDHRDRVAGAALLDNATSTQSDAIRSLRDARGETSAER